MDKYKRANQILWNEWTAIHEKSRFYDVKGFKAGKISLESIEVEEIGDVKDKSLLHLQCHFGLDTLSWARLGARVTGVDFSDRAIELGRSLSTELGLDARFVYADIYELPDHLTGDFDIVFTSYGVLAWLGDLTRWAEIIAHFLKPGGTFYMVEIHPFTNPFDDEVEEPEIRLSYPYFHSPKPMAFITETSYAEQQTRSHPPMKNYQWFHSLGDILNALTGVGLRLEFFHEFPYTCFRMLPFMEKRDDGWWHLPEGLQELPFLFSLKAYDQL